MYICRFLKICFFALSIFSLEAREHKRECFKHNIQLQLSDANGFPVDGTQFWVTLDIIKEGPKVTIQLPVIDFQTGPMSTNPNDFPPLVSGAISTPRMAFYQNVYDLMTWSTVLT